LFEVRDHGIQKFLEQRGGGAGSTILEAERSDAGKVGLEVGGDLDRHPFRAHPTLRGVAFGLQSADGLTGVLYSALGHVQMRGAYNCFHDKRGEYDRREDRE
jgi:hypothetical protein